MQLIDPNNPNEKKKIIVAAVLGIVAIGVLGYLFLGGSGSKKPATPRAAASPTPTTKQLRDNQPTDIASDDPSMYQPIVYNGSVPAVSAADRNIFSYYEPPPPQVPMEVREAVDRPNGQRRGKELISNRIGPFVRRKPIPVAFQYIVDEPQARISHSKRQHPVPRRERVTPHVKNEERAVSGDDCSYEEGSPS